MNIVKLLNAYTRRNIIYPEGEEKNIIHASYLAQQQGICRPWLIGDKKIIAAQCNALGIPEKGWYESCLPEDYDLEPYISKLAATGMNWDVVEFLLMKPLYFSAMMLREGLADAMVAGFVAESGEVINAATMIVGLEEGINSPSSYFLFEIPGFKGPEGELLVYADCGLQMHPSEDELADIAILTSKSMQKLLGWEPRVALLSFSTKGSAEDESTEKLARVVDRVKKKQPNLLIDGEMQADAALSPEVAAKKIPGGSPVAGKANILIFPNLEAGNISYKLTQRLTGATAYGPILTGFRKPVCDLSRGSSVNDILGVTAIAAVM